MDDESNRKTVSGPDPVSRSQLERLEAQRKTPRAERTLTPTLGGTQTVDAGEMRRREVLIDHIRERLDGQKGIAERDFALGKVRQRAKHDFDRGR